MSEKISRRDFLKLATAGAATTAVLTGCGPSSRYVTREPYTKMPEYNYNGLSTFYATTCRECAAGCGLIIRTMQGRAIKVEGNPDHPVNLGKTCARGQTSLEGLYNPDRVEGPTKQGRAKDLAKASMSWDDATNTVADALKNNDPASIAFLLGTSSDHLFDVVSDLTSAIGAPAPIRFGALSMFDAQATLSKAAEDMLGQAGMPFFDLANSDLVISFSANFLETWLSPVAYTRGYSRMRRGNPQKRGYFIQFEARMSSTAAKADEWIPLVPGTEGLVALAIGRLIAEGKGGTLPAAFANADVEAIAKQSGVSAETLKHIAKLFSASTHPLAIPGGRALAYNNGLAVAEAVLALNGLANNYGQLGGVQISPLSPNQDQYHRPASAQEMSDFIKQMQSGAIKVLLVHGVNPVFELPKSLGFAEALKSVPQVISFATFPDETSLQADFIFPDHHGLEAWGYQRVLTGTNQSVLSGLQPVVVGVFHNETKELLYDSRSTADVIIAAAKAAGDQFANALPVADEVEYIHNKLNNLVGQTDGFFGAADINTFAAEFQQHGGWWHNAGGLGTPSASNALSKNMNITAPEALGKDEFFFVPFVSPTLGEAGANKPWLQELADPTTTVMWTTWVEMNPKTAEEMGIEDDDVIKITSEAGEIKVSVYKYPAIRPDTIAVPFGQGHTAYGRFATTKDENGKTIPRGVNPADLFGAHFNEAGDLAFAGLKVKVEKTGEKRVLPRMEGKAGVYGFTNEK